MFRQLLGFDEVDRLRAEVTQMQDVIANLLECVDAQNKALESVIARINGNTDTVDEVTNAVKYLIHNQNVMITQLGIGASPVNVNSDIDDLPN
jgi:hypothetical protein